MPDRLPVRIDPYRLAEQNLTIKGTLGTQKMERYLATVATAADELYATLAFEKLGTEHYQLTGQVATDLSMTCQRCLEAIEVKLESDFELSIVTSDLQAEQMMDSVEPLLIIEGDMLELVELLEDELLLALPAVAMHAGEVDCKMPVTGQPKVVVEKKQVVKEPSPFEVLKDIKRDT